MKNSPGLKIIPEKEILKQRISVLETIALEVSPLFPQPNPC